MIETLTIEQALALHEEAIAATGGSLGFLNASHLEAALQRPLTSFGGVELFGTLYLKAAAIAHSIVTTHPFLDGNKRTAFLCAAALLYDSGQCIIADGAAIEAVIIGLIAGTVTLGDFAEWLEANSVPEQTDVEEPRCVATP
ncbi:MAG: Fic family protein [Armatimonadota bacterium]